MNNIINVFIIRDGFCVFNFGDYMCIKFRFLGKVVCEFYVFIIVRERYCEVFNLNFCCKLNVIFVFFS